MSDRFIINGGDIYERKNGSFRHLRLSLESTVERLESENELKAEVERWKREAGNYKGSFEVMCEASARKDGEIEKLLLRCNEEVFSNQRLQDDIERLKAEKQDLADELCEAKERE